MKRYERERDVDEENAREERERDVEGNAERAKVRKRKKHEGRGIEKEGE